MNPIGSRGDRLLRLISRRISPSFAAVAMRAAPHNGSVVALKEMRRRCAFKDRNIRTKVRCAGLRGGGRQQKNAQFDRRMDSSRCAKGPEKSRMFPRGRCATKENRRRGLPCAAMRVQKFD